MKLIVVGSSSRGNGYLLEDSNGRQLVIEAGCRLKEAQSLGLKISRCEGVVVTHIHEDHSRHLRDYTKVGLDVLSTKEVQENNKFGTIMARNGVTYAFGAYRVTALSVEHDVECFAYLIHHPEMGTLFFATDCYNLHQVIKGVTHYLIEANYSDEKLNEWILRGKTTPQMADRVRLSHMSLQHCIDYLRLCEAGKTAKTIVLIHGSSRHLDKKIAEDRISRAFGVATFVAESGLEVLLDKNI